MADKLTAATTYVASGSAFLLSFVNSYAAAIGILIATITLIMNWWFKWKHLELAQKKGTSNGDE